MKEYLINSGDFNIIVIPERRQYFLLGDDAASNAAMERFVAGGDVGYDGMAPLWFKYDEEAWKGFDGVERRVNTDVSESDLIDYFVLKKFNFGSLVAVRDMQTRKVQVFKRDRLPGATA